ncbi:MAG: methionyl-tRNA formyltransferase [Calditrichaeota bacterium]|nr:methionyl-tRNA formyltransferase [Calditrichota bacterium]
MRIIFFGSADFSVPSLDLLLTSGRHQVLAVVTAPDRPRGRGRRLKPTVVKERALEAGLPVLTPSELQDELFLSELRSYKADLFVVVAFRILPVAVFTMPQMGTINLHASLLPKYRGAAPIQWAIINGETTTGVTTFFIQEKVDTGDILLQRATEIRPLETAGELRQRLAELGAELLLETIDRLEEGSVKPSPQVGEPSRAPKVTREMGQLDWSRPAVELARLIRGLAPEPAAFSYWKDRLINFHRAAEIEESEIPQEVRDAQPGTVVEADARKGKLLVKAGRGAVSILELQPAGKRVMKAAEFLRGYKLAKGERFEPQPSDS